jgi:capsular exopolysaccharide synthesis family protein
MQSDKVNNITEEEESMIHQLALKYLPYWPWFLIAGILAIGFGFAYLKYATPIYQANATIIIKDEKKGNEESQLSSSLDQLSAKKIVENEMEVIQSRKLMDDVINKLGLYAPVYSQGRIRSTSAYLTCPIAIRAASPDSLITIKKIKLSLINNNQEVILNDTFRYPINKLVDTRFGMLEFVPNKKFDSSLPSANNFYFSLINPRYLVQFLVKALIVESSSKLSSIINLTYYDEVPKRAEDILNELINSYRQAEIDEKDALAKNTLAMVDDRLSSVTHDLDSIEKKIQQYKSSSAAVDIGAQGQLYLQNVSTNDQKLSEYNTQISVLNQVEKFVTNKDNAGGIVPSTLGVSDPTLTQLIDKLYSSQLEYDKLKKTVGENNPTLVSLRDQINKIKPNILQNIQSQEQSLAAAKQNVSATNGNYNSMLQAVPQKERQLLDISREQQIKSNLYSFLLQKKEESELAYASTLSNNRVVDFAQASPVPVSPNSKMIYIISLVSFMGICISAITLREFLNGKVLTRREVESLTSIPIVAELAYEKSNSPLVIQAGKRSYLAEEFRKLRVSLSFLGIDEGHKKILVTSSVSGEGKSFIAANLAVSLSLTGKKVVLVDLDLNKPTLQKILNVTQEEGITEYLTGKREPEEIIKRIKAHENLFFISPGNLPENPTELLANGKVKEIIEYLDGIFDVVIIDTSPIVLVTDGYLLTGLCDATLYVIRHKYTPRTLVKRIDQVNKINPIKNPAIIFNGVKKTGILKNSYGNGYGYGKKYGYGYGGKDTKKPLVKS